MPQPDHIPNATVRPIAAELARRILDAIGSLRYGSVEVVVHDSHVVQIDRKERFRVDRTSS